MESCCCPGSLSGSRCRFLSSGISAREAHGFPLSLLPGCQCPAPALQATGAGRRVHKETTGGLVWQSSAFQRLFGGVRSAPQTEPHGHTMGCPTPPPQQAVRSSRGSIPMDSCSIPSDWQKSRSQPSAGTGKCHPPGWDPLPGGHTLAVGVTWGKQQLAHSKATPQHEPTRVPTPSWVPWGSGH